MTLVLYIVGLIPLVVVPSNLYIILLANYEVCLVRKVYQLLVFSSLSVVIACLVLPSSLRDRLNIPALVSLTAVITMSFKIPFKSVKANF